MWSAGRRHAIFHFISVLFNVFTSIHAIPTSNLSIAQTKDSIYNQLINGQNLIVHEKKGAVFSRVGYYYEIDDIFGLTVTVPFSQYLCYILPMEQVEKLSLCLGYHPSELSCKQDFGQDLGYRNVSRS